MDATLIEAWASEEGFKPKDGEASGGEDNDSDSGTGQNGQAMAKGRNAKRDFHGEKRTNVTHPSTTDPGARLRGQAVSCITWLMSSWRTGMASSSMRCSLMPRHDQTGGCADYVFSLAKGHRIKLVTDKAYDTDHFVAALRNIGVTPHVAQNNTTGSLPSMAAPPGTAVTPFHCGSERGLKRSLARKIHRGLVDVA